jgi:DNA-binding PadR family transcriptional regulator
MSQPLRPLVFQILLILNDAETHGYGIMKAVNERTGRKTILGPATLYRTLGQMRDQGIIDETPTDDERRRVYTVSEKGRRLARAEAERMAALVDRARAGQLIG